MSKRITLLSLQTFSTTGGIQKMTRTLAHALDTVAARNNWSFKLWSLYDKENDLMPQYISANKFRGFNLNKIAFVFDCLRSVTKNDVIIISHINLAVVGLLAKVINPKCKVWVIVHGIEVWRPLSFLKNKLLKVCDKIICVSTFTQQEIGKWHTINNAKCEVLNNAIDPFMNIPANFDKPGHLMQRYKLVPDDLVVFTLARLASTEQYKGYEQVIKILNGLKLKFPQIKYILAGKYDSIEENRIRTLVKKHGVEDQVILTGFIDEDELPDHFLMADVFVLPSIKEGFGIVFIEAIVCGLPVICGNVDGSRDAVKHGELGFAVNPDDLVEIEDSIIYCLENLPSNNAKKLLQDRCLHYFNEDDYMLTLQKMLNDE